MLDSSTEEAIFDAALSLSDLAMRDEYLDAACQGDNALRQRIVSLLKAAEESGSFMRTPAVHALAAHRESIAEHQDDVCVAATISHVGIDTPNVADPADGVHRETLFDVSDDGANKPDQESLVGQTVGYYRVVARIGSGGMGEVCLAEDSRLGRKVALKIISPVWTAGAQHRFIREAQLASAPDHPNVCPIYDIGQTPEWCFIAMQYIEGQTLEKLIGTTPLASDLILSIALQAADALSAAHQRGIIHRDIKSRNIMVTSRGQAIVLDFGLATILTRDRDDTSRTARVVGTPAFMSPEQARGELLDYRSDIFSLGVVLFHMATGTTPFRGASRADVLHSVITEPHQPVRELNPEIPQELAGVIDRALCKAPEDRYQSVQEMASDLQAIQSQVSLLKHPASVSARRQRRTFAMLAAASLLGALGWFAWQAANVRWARQQIPVIEAFARAGRSFEAYDLATLVRKYDPGEPTLTRLWPGISDMLSVTSEPGDAQVYVKRFVPGQGGKSIPAKPVGTTPISREIARGNYIVSVEKEGFAPFRRTWSNLIIGTLETPNMRPPPTKIEANLKPVGAATSGMVFVPGGEYRLALWNQRPTDAKAVLDEYFIDEFEVSNRQYKDFVRAGGYRNARYWTRPFVKHGRTLSREEGMRELVDKTGRAGPRNWSRGTFPQGEADQPVTHITWYEAAAYAAFRGKSLPTIFQWEKAARYGANSNFLGVTMPWGMHDGSIVGRANLSTRGTVPVGSLEFGMSPFGCYDMAGNVSEWCLNETSEGFIVAGGSWASLPQAWSLYGKSPGFRHSDQIGFRCVSNLAGATGDQGAMRIDLDVEIPQYIPAPESEVKKWFDDYYEYDRSLPLDATLEITETDEWRRERISYNGADGERALAYLYVPKNFPRPHQVMHLRPAGDVAYKFRTVPQSIEAEYAPFVRSGRAVFAVVLRGYRERELPGGFVEPDPALVEYVEDNARQIVDMRRGLDYLLSRGDVDARGVAFVGVSFGGRAMVLPAIESRYSAVILLSCGIHKSNEHPAANSINFAPLVSAPKLLINGEYDESVPLKTAAEPLFELLTKPKEKRTYPGGHWPGAEQFVRIINPWLDKTLGPVKR
jgi:serine/threonine protein kinase/formylglycine-generating enzyme required for sulfatase activity